MIKDEEYWLGLDLSALALRIPSERPSRLRSEELGDAIWAVIIRCERHETLTPDFIQSLLGMPDRVRQRPESDDTVWEYDWIGTHGPDEYASSTSIVFRDGRMVRIERDSEVLP
jgi:hypothetical protein